MIEKSTFQCGHLEDYHGWFSVSFQGSLPPLKSVGGLAPLKHAVLPTVPDAEDVGHPTIENDLPDTTDVIVSFIQGSVVTFYKSFS